MNHTGMGGATAQHYQQVAAQMHSYMNGGHHHHHHHHYYPNYSGGMNNVYGGMFNHQGLNMPAAASNVISSGMNRIGIPAPLAHNIGGVAANFMNNLFT
ncbi:unnamed protein product [Didymodactylos carnosus]|uniref:Uncharacterized protein n=1 Tax=Didymodactylos carnosus TaxID=1234261 RepID=A0A815GZR1_9BILA|nr:unnamed protein product [Didymodactylos carnosus]CAF1344504.1 unnamed protein product [Didymodactylos carnosus]CAF4016841.1 unnamed protein product [Didymodactylos carnosus]CAF4208861.1 unnamed protein product [Didymodactylos carnosus]